ncbi:family 43 glycosylhydrolase [Blautia producta]|uniref:family 43 glycosylhydrolase n=1 Tax=Blautia producta TaxID=33035 RepID=UPI0031B62BE0
MKNMHILPWDDSLYAKGRKTAWLRPYTLNWDNPESDSLHLEYSYNGTDWYQLNGNNGIWFPDFGSKRLHSPAVYQLDHGTYLIAASDAADDSCIHLVFTTDFIHYTGAVYTGRDCGFEKMYPISQEPNENGAVEIPVELLSELQKSYGKPEPVLLHAVENVDITVKAGEAPRLPEKVTVEYTNGMREERNVVWDMSAAKETQKDSHSYEIAGHLAETRFPNPFIYHRADPFIYKHTDGMYYFTASYTDMEHNLDGKYQYLYIILRRSATLGGLADGSGAYEEKTVYERSPIAGGTLSPHIWAPEIHYIDGKWYIYYTTTISDESSWRIRPHCLECRDMDPFNGNWEQKGPVVTEVKGDIAFTDFSLDHTHFEHDGKHYFLWAQKTNNISDIFIAQLSNPWTLCTPAVRLSHPEYAWELHGFPVDEGPGVIKHGGKIFITFSGSGTDSLYCVGLLYADEKADLLDAASWKKLPYPVFQSSRATGQFGLGHNSFTRSDDDTEDLIIYHGRQEERYLVEEDYQPLYDAGRNASVGKIYWDEDGMPNFSVPSQRIVRREEDLTVRAFVTVK